MTIDNQFVFLKLLVMSYTDLSNKYFTNIINKFIINLFINFRAV